MARTTSRRTSVSPRPRGKMRLLLLEAASRIVDEHGRGAVSLRSLAHAVRSAGTPVTHTALLAHFHGLDALLAEVAAAWWECCADAIEAAQTTHGDAVGQLYAMSTAYIGYAIDHPHRFRLMYDTTLWETAVRSEDDEPSGARLAEGRDRGFAAFVVAVDEGQAAGQLSSALPLVSIARLLASLSHGLAMEFIDERLGEGIFAEASDLRQWQLGHASELLHLAIRGVTAHAHGA